MVIFLIPELPLRAAGKAFAALVVTIWVSAVFGCFPSSREPPAAGRQEQQLKELLPASRLPKKRKAGSCYLGDGGNQENPCGNVV